MRFWDSSAIVPLLIEQAPSVQTDRWFSEDASLAMWTLTLVEITSALWRLVRQGDLSEAVAHRADVRGQELTAASQVVVDIEAVKTVAQRVLRVHDLRAAAALQLSAALVWSGGRPQGKTLHTLDDRLALAARREGFDVP